MMLTKPHFTLLNPDTMPKARGYSQAVEVNAGKLVYIAGQVALDQGGQLVGHDDFRAQTQQVFANLKAAVEAAGGKFHDVVKLNYYLVDMSNLAIMREVRDQFIDTQHPPASTAVQVSKLFREEFLIEVEAIAVVA